MYIVILIRKLKPGKTYQDFVEAWYPDKGFDIPVQGPDLGINISDNREIAAVAYLDIADRPTLDKVIEETTVRAVFEGAGRYDFSSDETVEATRPR